MNQDSHEPRPPRAEPEIIPPGTRRRRDEDRVVFVEMHGGRIPLYRPSLFTVLLIGGLLGLAVAILLLLVLGAFLISLPVMGLVFVALLIGALLRAQAARRR